MVFTDYQGRVCSILGKVPRPAHGKKVKARSAAGVQRRTTKSKVYDAKCNFVICLTWNAIRVIPINGDGEHDMNQGSWLDHLDDDILPVARRVRRATGKPAIVMCDGDSSHMWDRPDCKLYPEMLDLVGEDIRFAESPPRSPDLTAVETSIGAFKHRMKRHAAYLKKQPWNSYMFVSKKAKKQMLLDVAEDCAAAINADRELLATYSVRRGNGTPLSESPLPQNV